MLDAMIESGCTADQIAAIVKASLVEQEHRAEDRRAKDAERQRRHRASRDVTVTERDNADSVTDPALSPSPNEINSNPHPHTHPDMNPRARKADPFPRPGWCKEAQHWTDLKANRKAKRLPNTPTAYLKFLRDIEQWVEPGWPPGRLLEAIVGRGWASAQYDPREIQNHGRSAPQSLRNDAGRGERRNPLLDLVRATEGDPEEDCQPDRQGRPALRAIGQVGP
jgi:hypothetical protein